MVAIARCSAALMRRIRAIRAEVDRQVSRKFKTAEGEHEWIFASAQIYSALVSASGLKTGPGPRETCDVARRKAMAAAAALRRSAAAEKLAK